MNFPRKWIFPLTLFVAVISFLLFLAAVKFGWMGETGTAGDNFCESARPGLIKQPANTWSNFAFIFFGLLIAWQSSKGIFSANKNLMTQNVFYAAFFSCIVVLLGPGSMAMHATQTSVGGFFDMLSMYLIASFMTAFSILRFFNLKPFHFVIIFSIVLAISIYGNFQNIHFILNHFGSAVFGFFIIVAIVFELLNVYVKKMSHNKTWGVAALTCLLTAFTIWNLSLNDAPFCDPSSIVQGHAIWHILDAVAAYCLFRHYVSEKVAE